MNENAVNFIFIVCVTILLIFFSGDPDIADAIIFRLSEK